jgi:hypothetical protein
MLKYLICLARKGRHNYLVRVEPGALFLQCSRCGRRSRGWSVSPHRVKRGGEPLRLVFAESIESVNPFLAEKPLAAWARRDVPVGYLSLTLAEPVQPERRLRERRRKTVKSPERRTQDRRRSSTSRWGRARVGLHEGALTTSFTA